VKKYKTNLETTMKKTVLLFAFTLGPAAVYAQSSVTLYGNIDTGFVLQSGGPKGWGVGMGSGIQDTNRWGLTGTTSATAGKRFSSWKKATCRPLGQPPWRVMRLIAARMSAFQARTER
jgi:hypothetical protein